MAARGGGRGGRGRGRGGSRTSFLSGIAQQMDTTPNKLWKRDVGYEPDPTFPNFVLPRPTKLTAEEVSTVKYYKGIRNKILEETPFYVTLKKRPAEDDEDDGIVRYRDRYRPAKGHRQTLRGFPTDESLFPDELKSVLQGGGTSVARRHIKKYNLDDFLEIGNEEELPDQTEDEPTRPSRADIIRDEDDDELEHRPPDPDEDEDLEEDDYGEGYFDNGEGDFDDYADVAGGDDD